MKPRYLTLVAALAFLFMLLALNQPWQSELVVTAALTKVISVSGLQVLPTSNALILVVVLLCLVLAITKGGFRYILAIALAVCLCIVALQSIEASAQTNAYSALTQKFEALSGLASADPHLNLATNGAVALAASLAAFISALFVVARTSVALFSRRGGTSLAKNASKGSAKAAKAAKASAAAKSTKIIDPWAETSDRK
jgi:hypothetical protein